MVEFMYTREYDGGVEERGSDSSEGLSRSENAGVGTLIKSKGHIAAGIIYSA